MIVLVLRSIHLLRALVWLLCLFGCSSNSDQNTTDASGGRPGTGGFSSGEGTGGSLPDAIGGSGGTAADGNGGSTAGAGGFSSTGGTSGTGGGEGEEDVSSLLSEFEVFWDFEDGDEQAVPALFGAGTLQPRKASFGSGPSGRTLQVDGEGSDAISRDTKLDTSSSFSISLWVRLDELSSYDTFASMAGAQVGAFYLQKRDNQRLSFATFSSDDTSAEPCVASAQIQPRAGEWYHVVGTRDAETREQLIYVDGALSGRTNCAGEVFPADGPLTLGSGIYSAEAADFFVGALDEVGLIQRVLSPQDVFDLYRAGRPTAHHYLFAYFVEVDQGRGDGLRLAHSHDGLTWGAIGAGRVFMPASVGGGSFRDPHVMLGPDDLYHLVWTTSCVPWAEANCVQDRGFGHAASPNMVDWSEADFIEVDLNVEHVWAPETVYDEHSAQFMVFWSSPLDADPNASDPHSIYYVLTSDFQVFSDPMILYSQASRNLIDATIYEKGGSYLMVIKDEADGQKNLRVVMSEKLQGPGSWEGTPSAPLTGAYAAEGPSVLEREGELFIYFDKYTEGAYGALRAKADAELGSPDSWQDVSSQVYFPGVRHGTPIEVSWETYESVALAAGAVP